MKTDTHESIVLRTQQGYKLFYPDDLMTFVLHYDHNGAYVGQEQDNIDGDGVLFFSAEVMNGQPCVNGEPARPLTADEMRKAV